LNWVGKSKNYFSPIDLNFHVKEWLLPEKLLFSLAQRLGEKLVAFKICLIDKFFNNNKKLSIFYSIGFAIAKKLGFDGAKIVISSRKSANVDKAVENLEKSGVKDVLGTVCHVAKTDDREHLLNFVQKIRFLMEKYTFFNKESI